MKSNANRRADLLRFSDAPADAPPDLAHPEVRTAMTAAAVPAVVRLAGAWKLTTDEACALLGDLPERTWFRMKAGQWQGTLTQDVLTRVSAALGIYKALHLLFSGTLADEWMRLPNRGALFGGARPIDRIAQGGIPALLDVRRHLDAMRGGL
jgi:hypothetical protein